MSYKDDCVKLGLLYKNNILNDLKKDFNVKNEKLPSFINSFFDRIEEETEITKDKFNKKNRINLKIIFISYYNK